MLLSMLPMVALPPGLREQVLRLVADPTPAGIGYRDLVVRRAAPFSHSGFPRPIESPRRIYGVRTMTAAASAAIIAAALLGTGTVFVLDALHHKGGTPVSAATIGPTAAPEPLASGSHRAKAAGSTRHHSGSDNGGSVGGSPQPSPSQPGSGSGSGPGSGGSPPTSSPQPTRSHSQSPTPPPSSPPASPGTLGVSPGSVTLTQNSDGSYSGAFTIVAQGGPVSGWDIVDPASAADMSIAPLSGGEIPAGQTVTITLSVPPGSGLAFETDLTVDPGGLTVVVDYPPAG
jgi:hypothetical protein